MIHLKRISLLLVAFALKLAADEEILIIPSDVEALLFSEPKHEDQECEENEQYIFCRTTCATCDDRLCRDPGCESGCGCKRNFYHEKLNGSCIHVSECPVTECNENEVFLGCGPVCEYCGPFRCKQIDCTHQCFCKPGYLRDADRNCIPENECPQPEFCSFHEVMSSPSRKDEYCWDEPTNETVDEERCNCLPHHRRSKTGFCINEDSCPPNNCDITETYYDCVPQCDTTCSNYGEEDCTEEEEFCYSACFCSRGLVMNDDGYCVRIEECNLKSNESTTLEILTRAFQIHFTQTLGVIDMNTTSEAQESEEDGLLRAQVLGQNPDAEEEEGEEKDDQTESGEAEVIPDADSADDVVEENVEELTKEEEEEQNEGLETIQSSDVEDNEEVAVDDEDENTNDNDQIENNGDEVTEVNGVMEIEESLIAEDDVTPDELETAEHFKDDVSRIRVDDEDEEVHTADVEDDNVAKVHTDNEDEGEQVADEGETMGRDEELIEDGDGGVNDEDEEPKEESEAIAVEKSDLNMPEDDEVEGEGIQDDKSHLDTPEGDEVEDEEIQDNKRDLDTLEDDEREREEIQDNKRDLDTLEGDEVEGEEIPDDKSRLDMSERDDPDTDGCAENEVLRECVIPCNNCEYKGECDYLLCEPGCDCQEGYHRNDDNECIPATQCPAAESDHEEGSVAAVSASSSDQEEE